MPRTPLHPQVLKLSKLFVLEKGDVLLSEKNYAKWTKVFSKAPKKERVRAQLIASLIVVTRHMLKTGAYRGPRQLASYIYLLGGQQQLADALEDSGFDRSAITKVTPVGMGRTPSTATGLTAPNTGITVRKIRKVKGER